MVVGDVVNTASRLQSAAPINGVLVGRETLRRPRAPRSPTRRRRRCREGQGGADRGLGRSEPGGRRPANEGSPKRRSSVASATSSCWRGSGIRCCDERRPHLVTVIGPAGIGKSRLAEEFARLVEVAGRPCVPRAIASVRRQLGVRRVRPAGEAGGRDLRQRRGRGRTREARAHRRRPRAHAGARTAPRLPGRPADRPRGPVLRGAPFRREASRATSRRCSSSRTSTGRIEPARPGRDARRADTGRSAAASSRSRGRSSSPTARRWGGGLTSYTALPLEPLDDRDAEQLAVRLLPGHEDDELAERLAAAAEGNPLFIEELAAVGRRALGDRSGDAAHDGAQHPRRPPRRARAGRALDPARRRRGRQGLLARSARAPRFAERAGRRARSARWRSEG